MKFLALIYGAPGESPEPGSADFDAYIGEYGAITEEYEKDGVMVASEALSGVETATSIRIRDGKVQTMDGPFAETKEHLGGFYLFDVPDLDTAIKYAQKIPDARYGTVEVRPVFDWTTMTQG